MKVLEKYKEKNKLNNVKLLIQNYENNLQELLKNEQLEEFIEKHLDLVDWNYISWKQILSEQFIEKYYIYWFKRR